MPQQAIDVKNGTYLQFHHTWHHFYIRETNFNSRFQILLLWTKQKLFGNLSQNFSIFLPWTELQSVLPFINCFRIWCWWSVFDFFCASRLLTIGVKRNTRFCPACRSNFLPRKWSKPIDRYCVLTDLTKEALPSSFLIEAFWVSIFTSGTFIWCSSLWLSRIPCSGTCVTTTGARKF